MLINNLKNKLICPICKSNLFGSKPISKTEIQCSYHNDIPEINGKYILIDNSNSVIDVKKLIESNAESPIKRNLGIHKFKKFLKSILWGNSRKSKANFELVSKQISKIDNPNILIVGGGTIGDGMDDFFNLYKETICSFDVFYSDSVDLIADAHQIPFENDTFDLVIIQAVLEHVLEPKVVVEEIHRILKKDGLVYAETPFLQQVHEGAYDFTRFTELGHINLFNNFKIIKSDYLNGLGTTLLWSIDYLIRGIFRSKIIGKIFKIMFFWVRFLDYIISPKNNIDGACGLYYIGQKSEMIISPKEILKLYKGAQ